MPGPMPYHLEKGPWILMLERYLNQPGKKQEIYDAPGLLAALKPWLDVPQLNRDRNFPTYPERWAHMEKDWFGYDEKGNRPLKFVDWLQTELGNPVGGTGPDTTADEKTVEALLVDPTTAGKLSQVDDWPSTGFWQQYYGNVEEIVCETLRRALTVALGIDDSGAATRDLPIEVFWKCPQRWFETWVTWRVSEEARNEGQVTLILATPGTGSPVLERYAGSPGAQVDPSLSTLSSASVAESVEREAPEPGEELRGMWTITHAHNMLLPPLASTRPRRTGDWGLPDLGPSYAGVGPIICVKPSVEDGGVHGDYSLDWSQPTAE